MPPGDNLIAVNKYYYYIIIKQKSRNTKCRHYRTPNKTAILPLASGRGSTANF